MERQVLISHAADDPDWSPEHVNAVASAIQAAGLRVHLDHWHQRDRKRRLSLAEWQAWMEASIDGATHILCLVSARYRALWTRDPGVQGGMGVAFESIRLIHHLYLLKQHNDGRILTLRPDDHGYDCIPRDLALDCPEYRWASDLGILLSHLGEAELPGQVGARPVTGAPASVPVLAAAPAARPALPSASSAPPAPTPTSAPAPAPAPAPAAPAAPPTASPVLPASPPAAKPLLAWASSRGEDRYGHWADLSVHGVTQRMRWIPPSEPHGFEMGDDSSGRSLEIIQAGFWLADTPCTQAFWKAVTGKNPSHFKRGADAPQRPVENVSWDDVMDKFIPFFAAMPNWYIGESLCLPTEKEWEYAARAGSTTAYWWGDAWDAACGNANVTGKRMWDDKEGTTPVKRYGPNLWGLYDVHGNVWEWCAEEWLERGDAPEARLNALERVVRGGSWFNHSGLARAACRSWAPRGYAARYRGFRFALRSPVGPKAR